MASKFTDDVRARYLDLLKLGFGRTIAATTVGLTSRSVSRYINSHPDFLEEVQDAEQHVIDRAQKVMIDLMDQGEFSATKLILERLDRNKWSDSQRTLKVEVEGAITHEMVNSKSVNEALEVIEAEIENRRLALSYDDSIETTTTEDDEL